MILDIQENIVGFNDYVTTSKVNTQKKNSCISLSFLLLSVVRFEMVS